MAKFTPSDNLSWSKSLRREKSAVYGMRAMLNMSKDWSFLACGLHEACYNEKPQCRFFEFALQAGKIVFLDALEA